MVFYCLEHSRKWCYLAVTVLCLVCYWNSLPCDLVHDDIFAIVQNKDLRPETPLTTIFQNDFWGTPMKSNTSHKSYRPICVLSFRLNYYIHGLDPFGYHLVNVLLHWVVSIFFMYFCETNVFHDIKRSFIAGSLFAVHPIHTEAVTGVVGRAELLACLFFLISLHLYERDRREDNTNMTVNNNYKEKVSKGKTKQRGILIASIIFGSLSMLCKETGITVFGVCVCLELIYRKNFLLSYVLRKVKHAARENLNGLYSRIGVVTFAVAILFAFRIQMLHGKLPAFNEEDNPASFSSSLATRFLTYCYLCAFNSWLLISPVVLSYDWQIGSIPLVESFTDVRNVFSLLLFCGLALLAAKALLDAESGKVTLIGLALLVIPFIPASNLFIRVGFVVAERVLYIPSVGYCILVANGLQIMLDHFNTAVSETKEESHRKTHNRHTVTKDIKDESNHSNFSVVIEAIVIIIIAVMVARTVSRNQVWRNRETLFRSGVEILPHNAKVHYNYANFLKDNKKTEEAIRHYKIAVKLYPKHASSHNNLATLLGESEEAEFHLKQTLLHNPYHSNAMFNLASIYKKRGNNELARSLLERCLSLSPDYSPAIEIYAEVLYALGEREKSEEIFFEESLRSNDSNFFNNYGVFLGNIGKGEESVNAFKKSIELNPSHKMTHVNLGRQLRAMGRDAEAEKWYRSALLISRDENTLQMLGVLLYHMRRLKEAELTFSEAVKHNPTNTENIKNYALSVFEQGLKEEAIGVIRNGLKRVPESSILLNLLANFLSSVNRHNQALKVIDSGLKLHPKDSELHFLRANIFREQDKIDLALESYKEVTRINPKHFGASHNVGVIYHLKGLKVEAEHYYNIALAIDPSNQVVKDNLKKLMRSDRNQETRTDGLLNNHKSNSR